MSQTSRSPDKFRQRIRAALEDEQLRSNFRGAMDFLRNKRKAVFSDQDEWHRLRNEGQQIRNHVTQNLPDLLLELEANCTKNGIKVHWAETGAEANQIIGNIAKQHKAKLVIKGKSMASEEIELNDYLQQQGIECIESDMGEYIVQIANETPSHIIMPAIHKNKVEIAQLFENKLNIECDSNDVDGMIGIGRDILRKKFETADVGISGVNFAAAKTGTLCLVENEGNGRMSTTVPPIHIAIMGIEKVIPSLDQLPTLQKLLTRSATGQTITSYLNLINGPRRTTELDGPKEVHLVILDNGRTAIQANENLRETLNCIRCGACMNHCPVYTKIGGHAYGSTYPGPIGQVVTPQLKGIDKAGELLDACSLNGACGEACPVHIDLPQLIRELRNERSKTTKNFSLESSIWSIWSFINRHPKLYRIGLKLFRTLNLQTLTFSSNWTHVRTTPKPAKRTLHEMWQLQDSNSREYPNDD